MVLLALDSNTAFLIFDSVFAFRYSYHASVPTLQAMTTSRDSDHSPVTALKAMPTFRNISHTTIATL